MRIRTACAAALLLLAVALPSAGAMPSQLRAFAVIHGHGYRQPYHRVTGVLRLNNMSSRTMKLSCLVVVTWSRPSGETAKRHRTIDAQVGAHTIRKPHFHMRFKDPDHLFDNLLSNAVPHCRLA